MKFKAILSVFLFISVCYATNAVALEVAPLFGPAGENTLLSDNSADFFIHVPNEGSTDSTVDVGDIILTMVGINTIGPTIIGSGTVYNEVTALTAVKITSAGDVDLGPPGTDDSFGSQNIDLWQYEATPLTAADDAYFDWADIDASLSNDGMFFGLVMEDSSKDYNRDSTVDAGIASAINGTLRLLLDIDATEGDFLSVIAPYNVPDFGTVDPVTAIDNTNIALDATIRYQNWGPLIFDDNLTGGNGGFSSPSVASGWPAFDNLDFTVKVIPEPATLTLFGIGLLSLAAVARRRKG